jgi:hypothetical protein
LLSRAWVKPTGKLLFTSFSEELEIAAYRQEEYLTMDARVCHCLNCAVYVLSICKLECISIILSFLSYAIKMCTMIDSLLLFSESYWWLQVWETICTYGRDSRERDDILAWENAAAARLCGFGAPQNWSALPVHQGPTSQCSWISSCRRL